MKNVRRLKRMARGGKKKRIPPLNLVSLMDVFTILVFFLLVNSANTEELSNPKSLLELPKSVAERKPAQTLVVMVTTENIMVRGENVASVSEVMSSKEDVIEPLNQVLIRELARVLDLREDKKNEGKEVTIMADRTAPFKLLKRVMTSCSTAGYSKISLAVLQKASQSSKPVEP